MEHLGLWPTTEDAGRREWVPLRQLGWAFLLAWVFCVFYTNAAGVLSEGAEAPSLASSLFYLMLPVATSVATLVAIVAAEPRLGAPTSYRALIIAAPLVTAASTPFMFVTLPHPLANALLFGAAALATGIGSALLWVMWGEYYAVVPRDQAESLAPASAVSAAVIVLLVSAMDGWVSIGVASVLPLLSGLCFWLVWTPDAARIEGSLAAAARKVRNSQPLAGLDRTGFGILIVFAIVSIAGMTNAGYVSGASLQAIMVFSALMMAVVAAMAVSGPRRISLFFLYRWMCPTLVVGFCAIILFGQDGTIIAVAASLGGRFTFCLIAQIYFANYAAAGRATPTQASSLGWLFVHAGDLLGGMLWLIAQPVAATPEGLVWTGAACIVVLVTVTMVLMGNSSTFLRIPEQKQPTCEDPAPSTRAPREATAQARDAARAVASETGNSLGAEEQVIGEEPLSESPQADGAQEDPLGEIARNAGLTPRETEVFALLAQGRSIPYIRDELIISRETAATHAKHIYAKLGVHSRQELIDLAQQ